MRFGRLTESYAVLRAYEMLARFTFSASGWKLEGIWTRPVAISKGVWCVCT